MPDYYIEPRNILANGLTLLQVNPECAADLRPASRGYGWLYQKGPEVNQWVSIRHLSNMEIEEAQEQAAGGLILRIVRCG